MLGHGFGVGIGHEEGGAGGPLGDPPVGHLSLEDGSQGLVLEPLLLGGELDGVVVVDEAGGLFPGAGEGHGTAVIVVGPVVVGSVLAGILLIGVMLNGMTLLDLNVYQQNIVKGLVLLGALVLDNRLLASEGLGPPPRVGFAPTGSMK